MARLDFEPEQIVFLFSIIALASLLFLTLYYLRVKRSSEMFKYLSSSLEILLLSIFILTIGILIGSLDDIIVNNSFNIFEEAVYSLAYLLYLSLWFYGNNHFLNSTVKIPEDRQNNLRRANSSINGLILLLLFLAIVSSSSFFFPSLQDNDLYFNIIELLFALSSQLAIVLFVYFWWNLNIERKKNVSKLIKARLELLNYAILFQIIISIMILVGVILLIFVSKSQDQDRVVEAFLFSGITITSVVSYAIIVSSMSIPQWVRRHYDLGASRFDAIQKLKISDDN